MRSPAASRPLLPLLLALFVGSGTAALIYEIVWLQLLQLVIGSSAVSLGGLLGTFMGGMCLGSLALPRLVSARHHPLRVYALLELGIGVVGLVVLFGMPYVGGLYVATVGHGLPGILLRALVCAVCLLPPTLMMGATLPAMARWIETTPQGVSWLGFLYGGNIAGAVFGCLLAGFYLLRVHDLATATCFAAAINGAVALSGLALARVLPYAPPAGDSVRDAAIRAPGSWPVYVTIALSGMCALGAEVVWTRLLSLMLGGTVYTFSLILAVFLAGLGIGSSAGSVLARGTLRPRVALGWCQMLLAAAIAWTAYMLARSLPYWPINPWLSTSPWLTFQLDLVRCMWAILPAACLWGASFPLALAAVAAREIDPGRLVGGVYAANTLGAIVGAVGSMFLIGSIGTQHTQRVLIGASIAAALLMLVPIAGSSRARDVPGIGSPLTARGLASALPLAAASILAVGLAGSVSRVPSGVVAYGRLLPTYAAMPRFLYVGEGMNASIAVSQLASGVRHFHVSGKVEASTEPQDMRLQRMLGHIPALLHPNPRSVLVVGFGAGITAGSFVPHAGVERIVVCEIEPLIPAVVGGYFAAQNYDVLGDRRVHVVYDDARHHILTTRERFDVITSDPIHPWVKGAATLYTKEYFELVRQHLNPGGVVSQWVPLYESNRDVVKSEVATFLEVFPDATIWANEDDGRGYDLVLVGRTAAAPIDVDALQRRLDRADHRAVAASLGDVGLGSAVALLGTYAGRGPDLAPWLKGAAINRDRNLRLQYLAGLGLNLYRSDPIYEEMLAYRRFPEELFVGSSGSRIVLTPRPSRR
jgi:spermidine synthase